MENVKKIITDIIEDNTMKLQTPTGKSNTEYYQTKIDVCNQILEKVRRENAQSEKSNYTIPDVISSASEKVAKAKDIVAEIYSLYHYHKDGYQPKGYGNWELNKATDAMYAYIKEIEQS